MARSESPLHIQPIMLSRTDIFRIGLSTIQVLVGESETCHTVHLDRIIKSSDFFAKALNGNFKEKEEGVVRLPEQKSEDFALYVEWLYSGVVCSATEDDVEETEFEESEEWCLLLDLYVLGDAIQDTAFQNTVLDGFIERMNAVNRYPTAIICGIFGTLPPASSLRKLFVDVFVHFHSSNWLDEFYPKEFLLAVSKALMEKLTDVLANPRRKTHDGKPWEVDPCRYRVHP